MIENFYFVYFDLFMCFMLFRFPTCGISPQLI